MFSQVQINNAAQIGDTNFWLEIQNGQTQLRTAHKYYDQIRGQMKVCRVILVFTDKGLFIERIPANVNILLQRLCTGFAYINSIFRYSIQSVKHLPRSFAEWMPINYILSEA